MQILREIKSNLIRYKIIKGTICMIQYIKQAIKNPHLIKSAIYKKHLGVILSCDMQNYTNCADKRVNINQSVSFTLSEDYAKISDYYQRMGRSSITKEKSKEWLEDGHHCWLAILDGKVVGGLWIFFGQVRINPLSARVLSENKTIRFNDDIGYQGYVLIDSDYRGQGIYSSFNDYIMNYYCSDGKIKSILLIT